MPQPKHWLKVQAKAKQPRKALVTIDGEIGGSWWDDTAVASSEFMNALKALGQLDDIEIDLNSPGGSVTDGLTIANYLRAHPAKVTVNVLGQASSIASVITSAADQVNMSLGTFGLIHYPWTFAMGNANQFRELADNLDTISDGIMGCYLAKCGEDKKARLEEIIEGPSGEGTLLSAEEWLELGLADNLQNEVKAAASTAPQDLFRAMQRAQQQAQKQSAKPQPPQAKQENPMTLEELKAKHPELVQALTDEIKAQNPQGTLEVGALTLDTLKAQHPELVASIQKEGPDAKAAVEAERTRVTEIMKACTTYNQPQMAEKLIANGTDKQMAADLLSVFASNASDQNGIVTAHSADNDPQNASDANRILANYRSVTGTKTQTA
ncbi:ATP-dependent protease ClpP, protease subunit [Marinospirillum celere]|uniref:ATP-dependent Clp protease proteolytic subunit n=1 Tax=Marinospirillum celere TaxID=1122252 RepID=A0A1I1E1V6_9GAMM|nr:head maturation protease, ClpP-related [Marinospirillum celere]SFB80656.1 ATP-dependent protease ClpP, protease subunit [Marinospirillum celere]